MLKDVDFAAIVFKFAFLQIIVQVIFVCMRLKAISDNSWGVGVGGLALGVLLLIICCYAAARKTPETEDTERITLFILRLYGVFLGVRFLGDVPEIFKLIVQGGSLSHLEAFKGMLSLGCASTIYGISLLFFPGFWNRLILWIGRGARTVVEKDRVG